MNRCSHEPRCADFPAHQKRQRADWRQAQARRNKALRNDRVRRKTPSYQPGMNIKHVSPEES